jgi:hypothetical protein
MNSDVTTWMLIATTVVTGVGAGATLDQAIKQLPARHRIGPSAYADYVRAADLGNGLIWYPILGIGTTLVTLATVLVGFLHDRNGATTAGLYAIAAGLAVQLGASVRAAPTLLGLKKGADPAATLDKFARSNAIRAVAVTFTLAATTYTLAARVFGG